MVEVKIKGGGMMAAAVAKAKPQIRAAVKQAIEDAGRWPSGRRGGKSSAAAAARLLSLSPEAAEEMLLTGNAFLHFGADGTIEHIPGDRLDIKPAPRKKKEEKA